MNKFEFLKCIVKKKNPIFEVYMRGKKVVDFGCGPTSIVLKDKVNFVGFDLNENVIKNLKAKGCNVKLGSVTDAPYEDNTFETVHCSNVIEHLDVASAYKMLQEMMRVLIPGGHIIITTPMPSTVWNTFGHVKPYTPMSLKKLSREDSYESFDPIHNLKYEYTIYYGKYAKNKYTFVLSSVLANLFTCSAGSHLTVMKKVR